MLQENFQVCCENKTSDDTCIGHIENAKKIHIMY